MSKDMESSLDLHISEGGGIFWTNRNTQPTRERGSSTRYFAEYKAIKPAMNGIVMNATPAIAIGIFSLSDILSVLLQARVKVSEGGESHSTRTQQDCNLRREEFFGLRIPRERFTLLVSEETIRDSGDRRGSVGNTTGPNSEPLGCGAEDHDDKGQGRDAFHVSVSN